MDYSDLNCDEGRDFIDDTTKNCELKKLRKNYVIVLYGIFGFFVSFLVSLAIEWICYAILYSYGFGFDGNHHGIRPDSWAENRLKYGPIMYDDGWFAYNQNVAINGFSMEIKFLIYGLSCLIGTIFGAFCGWRRSGSKNERKSGVTFTFEKSCFYCFCHFKT